MAALAVVAATVLYLAIRAGKRLSTRTQSSCGGCGDCAAAKPGAPAKNGLVEIDSLVESARRQS